MVKVRNSISILCLCFILAWGVCFAQPLDKLNSNDSAPNSQSHTKKDTQGLSHYIVGAYFEDLGDLDGAICEYLKALEADPGSSLLHLNLASVFIKKNDAVSAISQLKQSINLEPLAVEPHALLALLYATQDKTELATQEYTLALKNAVVLEPENIEIYKSLGIIYLQQKKLKEAQSIFKIIVGIAPADPEAHFYLGSIYFDSKDYPGTEKELKRALKLKPDYHQALNFLGYFYLEQDKFINQAGAMIKKALIFEPENGAYIDSLGWYYFKKKNFKQAQVELEKAAALMSDPVIYEHLGDVYLKLGNREGVKINWEKSLKLDSTQDKLKARLLEFTANGK